MNAEQKAGYDRILLAQTRVMIVSANLREDVFVIGCGLPKYLSPGGITPF